ncbi:unnamed protein product [Trichobilharzia szidati]|nr:unnamed protein product [Trichobilharzia szidati]
MVYFFNIIRIPESDSNLLSRITELLGNEKCSNVLIQYGANNQLNSICEWIPRIGGICGALALIACAYGTLGLWETNGKYKKIFQMGAHYHLIHSLAINQASNTKHPILTTTLLVIGTTLFSGSCYYVAISGNESASKFAPIGGLTLLLAWISMIL